MRYFVAVAEELHFGHAAERLHISQPSLSAAIRSLEGELGCALFNRTSRQVELTTAGEVLLERARATLRMADEAVAAARDAGRGISGQLRVGVTPMARHGLAPAVLAEFRSRFPHVEVIKREEMSGPMIAEVASGELDVALCYCAERVEGISYELVKDQSLVMVVADDHPLARRESIALAELAESRFLMPSSSLAPGFRGAFERLCRTDGFSPQRADGTVEFDEDLLLVRSGAGVVVIPGDYLGGRPPGVRIVPIEPRRTLPIELAVRDEDRPPHAVRFAEVVREVGLASGWLDVPPRAAA